MHETVDIRGGAWIDLATQVESLRRQAEDLHAILSGRPLLECPQCGLFEDTTAEMLTITSFPDAWGVDCGLRFLSLDEEGSTWFCPRCGGVAYPSHVLH